jgi:membrane protein YqaA with SNARE-associated domain
MNGINAPLIVILIALFVFAIISFLILRKEESRKKFFFFLFIIALIFCVYLFRYYILEFFKGVPWLWSIVGPIVSEVQKGSLLGLFYLTFFGSLFFISIPAELSILYYLSLGHNPVIVIIITIIGNLSGHILDYLFGMAFGENLLTFFLKGNKIYWIKGVFEKIGGLIIVIANILPFGAEIVVLVLGAIRYNFKKFLIYSVIGMTTKYVSMFFLERYITENILPKIKEFFSF